MKTLQKLALGLGASVIAIGTGLTFYTQQRFGTDPLTHIFQPVRQTMTWPPQPQPIGALQFSPDGQSIFTLSGDVDFLDILSGNVSSSEITTRLPEEGATATVRQWDVVTGEALAVFTNPIWGEEGGRLSFDATTQRLAFQGRESILEQWDVGTGESSPLFLPEELQNHLVTQHFISDDGQVGAARRYHPEQDEWSVLLWALKTGEALAQIPLTGGERLVLNQDGSLLAAATQPTDSEPSVVMSVWEVATGSKRDERQISLVDDLSASQHRWHHERKDLVIEQMGFGGETLWFRSSWNTQQAWDFATNTLIDPQSLPSEFTSSNLGRVLTSVDGRWVAASGRGTLRLYDLRTDTSLAIANAPESSRLDNVHLAFSPDSQQIALRGDQEIQIRETASGRLLNTFETTPHGRFLTFSSDGQTLISSNPDGSFSRWPVATGDVTEPVQSSGFIQQAWLVGNTLLTVGNQPVIRIWDGESQQLLAQVMDPEQRDFALIGLIPSGVLVTLAYNSTTLRLWDALTAAPIMTLDVGGDGQRSYPRRIVANRQMLVSSPASNDYPIAIWDLETQARRLTPDLPDDLKGRLALSDDLLAVEIGRWIHLKSTSTGDLTAALPNPDWTTAMSFSADGELLAVGSMSNELTLWHVPSQRKIRKIPVLSRVTSLAFSPDDRLLAVGDVSGHLQIWELP